MPYRKEQLVNGEIYHIVIRSLDDLILFKDINDYFRMIFSVYEFNDTQRVRILEKRKARMSFKKKYQASTTPDVALTQPAGLGGGLRVSPIFQEDVRDRMVDILCFEWMPNHIHLLLKQLQDGGISKFMQKVGIGYSKYYNTKYLRRGHLLQDSFRAVHIQNDTQLMNAFVYILTNAVALIEPGWKENGVKDPEAVKKFLEQKHRWGSYWDYLGKKNFPSVTQIDFMLEVMGGSEGIKRAVDNWIDYKGEVNSLMSKFFEREELILFE